MDKKYKFNLNTLTKDDFKNIKETSEKLFTEDFLRKMINQDFVKQLEALKEMKDNLDKKENIIVYFDNLDIILKLVSMKTYNNVNPALTKGLCEFLESLYNSINEHDYNMTDIEINMILALLMEKLQINNIEIKTQVNHLMKLYITLFDIYKIIMQILNMTLISNNKIKAGILEFILDLNENENLDICNKNFIRIFALFLHCNDNDVKIRLLELFRNIYDTIGDDLWNLNDIITPKEKNYLKNNLFKEAPNNNRQRNMNPNENENYEENENENYEENENDENGNYEEEYNEENEENDNYDEEEAQYGNPTLINKNNMNNINMHNNRYAQNAQNMQNMQNAPVIHSVNNLGTNRSNNLKNPKKANRVYDNQYEKYEKDEINNDDNNDNDENIGDENTYYHNLQNNNDSDTFLKFNEITQNTFENNNQINMQNAHAIKDRNETASQKQNNVASNISKVLNILKKSKNNNTKSKLSKVTPINNNNNNNNNPKRTYNNNTVKDLNLEESANDNNNNNINVNRGKNNKSLEQRPKMNNKLLSSTSSHEGITSEKELLKIMNSLSSEDESEKLNSIIIVHEILCTKYQENKYILIPNIDNIISIFIKITHNLFDAENIENISAKFAKYLVTILCKIAANKELITHMTYKVLNELIYELLNYLLISNLDKIGENQEGNIIFKSLNSAMLRILENCDTTSVILVLLEIIKQNQIKEDDYNLSNLAIKCLIKITQNLKEYINNIQFDKILLQMHLILINYDKNINKMEIKTQTDIMTVKFIKNFIIDVVKIKQESVLQDYNNLIQNHKFKDKHIYAWIKNTLLMIRNMKENKQIISDNISKSTINKTSYNEEFENDNEPSDRNQSSRYNNSENRMNDNMPSITEENGGEKGSNLNNNNINNKMNNMNNINNNNLSKSTNINPNASKMNKANSKKININNNNNNKSNNENKGNFKEDYMSIIERIKLLKQNLKENSNANLMNNNSTQIKRKKSIEINKKNKKK